MGGINDSYQDFSSLLDWIGHIATLIKGLSIFPNIPFTFTFLSPITVPIKQHNSHIFGNSDILVFSVRIN